MHHIQTRSVHTGVYVDTAYNSVTTPIYPTSNFYFDAIGKTRGYDYTRSGNPTRSALEQNLASLEGGAGASITCTGMSAVTTAMMLFRPGDHVICGNDTYGGTHRLFAQFIEPMGIAISYVNMHDPAAVRAAIRDETRCLWIETPSNPLLNLTDIAAVVAMAREHGRITTIADNTFLSPYFQKPLALGVDLVMHSTTKYLNGHSDVVGGALIARTAELAERVAWLTNALGTACSPFDAFLVLRGVKTLALRMEAHQRSASALAEFLDTHERVQKVYYPGLPHHPGHALAKTQQSGFGGMLSFEVAPSVDLDKLFAKLELFLLAESLGGVESLIEQPWTMSHASMSEAARRAGGIIPQLVRMSAGVEHPDDLVADMVQALEVA